MNVLIPETKTSIKVIGANGQISLGKHHAGRQVLVEEREPGVWMVRIAVVIPENERWLHKPQAAASLQTALDWVGRNGPKATDTDTLFQGVNHAKQSTKPERQARSEQSRISKKPA